MFISPAYAQAANAGSSAQFSMFIPLVLIFIIMYFLIIRPQRAQMKKHQEMVSSARRGDTVVTGGGLVGKVTKVYDEAGELEVELSEGVRVRVVRSTLSGVRVKGEPATDNSKIKADHKNQDK